MAKEERTLPEGELTQDFVICDNTLNRYSWRLLVEGIDHSGFDKNPVCLVMHNTYEVSIGRWTNLRTEKGELKGTLVFDRNDEIAVKYYWKYKDGYMNAVSLNVLPVEESNDASLLVKGQKYETVTKSELLEISLVSVPGQKNAVKLTYLDGVEYKLNLVESKQTNPKTMAENKNEQEAKLQELKAKLTKARKLNAENLVKVHEARGVVQEGESEHLIKLALESDDNYETVSKMLSARKVKDEKKEDKSDTKEADKLAEQMRQLALKGNGGDDPKNERASWDYYQWFKKDHEGLMLMSEKEPDKFKKLEESFMANAKKQNLV